MDGLVVDCRHSSNCNGKMWYWNKKIEYMSLYAVLIYMSKPTTEWCLQWGIVNWWLLGHWNNVVFCRQWCRKRSCLLTMLIRKGNNGFGGDRLSCIFKQSTKKTNQQFDHGQTARLTATFSRWDAHNGQLNSCRGWCPSRTLHGHVPVAVPFCLTLIPPSISLSLQAFLPFGLLLSLLPSPPIPPVAFQHSCVPDKPSGSLY